MPHCQKMWQSAADTRALQDCAFFLRGSCTKGSQCPFKHDPSKAVDLRREHASQRCVFFLQGRCSKGSLCPFKHDLSSQPAPPEPSSAPVVVKVATVPSSASKAGALAKTQTHAPPPPAPAPAPRGPSPGHPKPSLAPAAASAAAQKAPLGRGAASGPKRGLDGESSSLTRPQQSPPKRPADSVARAGRGAVVAGAKRDGPPQPSPPAALPPPLNLSVVRPKSIEEIRREKKAKLQAQATAQNGAQAAGAQARAPPTAAPSPAARPADSAGGRAAEGAPAARKELEEDELEDWDLDATPQKPRDAGGDGDFEAQMRALEGD